MESFVWMLLLSSAVTFIFRWLLTGRSAPISGLAIRGLLLQRLQVVLPAMELRDATDNTLSVCVDGLDCVFHLDQLYRRCAESPASAGLLVRQAVKSFARSLQEYDRLPDDWEQRVIPLLLRTDVPIPPTLIVRPLFEGLALGYAVNLGHAFRWLTLPACDFEADRLHALALRNLERSCNALVIDTSQLSDDKQDHFLRFSTADGLDAARVVMPSFFQRFSPRFGDTDLLVSIPSRDSLAIISAQDHALTNILTWRSTQEYARRAYPLCARLIKVSETGIVPWPPRKATTAV